MTFDGSAQGNGQSMPNSPLLVPRRSDFQWSVAITAPLAPGWQDHITDYLAAVATVSLSFQDEGPLVLTEAKLLDDPRELYQLTVHERSVEVRARYRALSQPFLDAPYDCQLLLKTPVGGRFVTIAAPKPPGPAEWQHLVKKLWFQLLLAGGDLPVAAAAEASPSVKGRPLYTFKLHPELQWSAPPVDDLLGQVPSEWHHELRLVIDAEQPDRVHAQVDWAAVPRPANQMMVTGPLPRIPSVAQKDQKAQRQARRERLNGGNISSTELALLRSPQERGGRPSRWRVVLLTMLLLVLLLLAFLAVSATRGKPHGGLSLLIPTLAPTAVATPSPALFPTSSPTNQSTSQPTPSTAPSPTTRPYPTATATPRPTATATAVPTATATPSPTATATPSPTATPTPVVNLVVTPTSFSQSCTSTPTLPALVVTLDNTGSNVAVNWQINITDTDPAGHVWATASATSGTVPVGQSQMVTITPISTLCQDMAGVGASYTAPVSYSAAGQSGQSTVTDAVSP